MSRIPSLDGLRAFSILLVMAHHTLQTYNLHTYNAAHPVWKGRYAAYNGQLGVSIFFEISGFLITSLLLQERAKRGSISLRDFYVRRAFRILPPLYLYIGVIVLLGLVNRLALDRTDIVSSLFFFHNFSSSRGMWALEHLWTISVEEQFYFVWPFLLVFCLTRRGDNRLITASVFPFAIILISPIARVLLRLSSRPALNDATHFFQFDFIMFGCLVALLQNEPRFESLYRMATRRWWVAPSIIAVCSVLSARYQNYFSLTVGYTISGAAIAVFLLWSTRNPTSSVGRILNWKPVVWIGVLSYSIYLWQTLLLHGKNTQVFGASGVLHWISIFPVNWISILAIACLSYYLVEQPFLRARSRLVKALHHNSARVIDRNAAKPV